MSDQPEQNQGAIPLPQPDDLSPREKDDAMGGYFMTFATLGLGLPLPFISLLANIIYHAINAKKSRFVAFHSLQALLSGLPVALLNAAAVIWAVVEFWRGAASDFKETADLTAFWVFLVFMLLVNLLYVVFSIIAALRAQKGRFYYFPIVGAFAYQHYYVRGKGFGAKADERNLPPSGF